MKKESDAILVIRMIKIENKLVFFLKKTQKDNLIDMTCETNSRLTILEMNLLNLI